MVPYGVRCQFIHKFSPKADARDGEMMRFKETKEFEERFQVRGRGEAKI